MDKAWNSGLYQRTSEPMEVCASQKSRENGLDQGWTKMMSELHKISSNKVKETKQRPKTWKKDKKPFYKARFPADGRKNNNKRWEKEKDLQVTHVAPAAPVARNENTTELQREKHKNQVLQKELERVTRLYNELNERYQSDVGKIRQQANTSQYHLENEIKQKTLPQTCYEKLDAAHTLSQQKFSAELQGEGDTCKALHEQADQQKFSAECATEKIKNLQHELDTIRVSHSQLRQLYDTDVVTVRQEAETLQRELNRETKAHADTVSEGWRVINALRAEQDALRQKMAEDRQNTFKRERTFERELRELKSQLKEQISVNLKLSTKLQAEKEKYGAPRIRFRCKEKDECEPMEYELTINPGSPLRHMEDVEMSEENLPETTRTPSLWKSPHHFLGLKLKEVAGVSRDMWLFNPSPGC